MAAWGSSHFRLRWFFFFVLVATLALGSHCPPARAAAVEEVLFFDARPDQTGTTNGGVLIWNLHTNSARWWFQNVKHANVSPNGKLVAYLFGSDLLLTDIQGRNPKLLSRTASDPVFSPQGDRIAFVFAPSTLRIISLDGTILKSFPNITTARPSWSPDGSKIAYNGGSDVDEIGCELFDTSVLPCPRTVSMSTVFTLDINTGQSTRIFTPSYISQAGTPWNDPRGATRIPITTTQIHMLAPEWSPDGSQIACELRVLRRSTLSAPGSGVVDNILQTMESNIVLIPPSGGGLIHVTGDLNPPPYSAATLIQNTGKTWADDGRLFFSRIRGARVPEESQGTFVASPGGGAHQRINGYIADHLQWTRLNQTGLELEIRIPKPQLKRGENSVALLRVVSREDQPQIITFAGKPLRVGNETVVRLDDVPIPASFSLTRESFSRSFFVPLTALEFGETKLFSAISVRDLAGNTRQLTAQKDVSVVFGGDLLIGKEDEPEEAFGLDNVYQKVAGEGQIRTHKIDPTRSRESTFRIIVENDTTQPQAFFLGLTESAPSRSWDVSCFFNGEDISVPLRSSRGFQLPELSITGRHGILVRVNLTNAVPGDPSQLLFSLTSTNAPNIVLDSVEAITQLPEANIPGIEVNQVLQDWNNSVPLIAQKRTVVRVFIQAPNEDSELLTVRGVLRGFRNQIELPESPLPSIQPSVDRAPSGLLLREFFETSMNFDLPLAWTHGTVELRFEPSDFRPHFLEPAEPGGKPADGIIAVKFEEMPELPLVVHPVAEQLKSGEISEPTQEDLISAVRRLRVMLPIPKVHWGIGFKATVLTTAIPEVEDYWRVNAQIQSDGSYLDCNSLQGCPLHQAMIAYVGNPALVGHRQGQGLAEDYDSHISTAGLLPTLERNTTVTHELAHCLGRHHAVSALFGVFLEAGTTSLHGVCGESAEADTTSDYPYFRDNDSGKPKPFLGPLDAGDNSILYGFDAESDSVLDPTGTFELMSYCEPLWPSKYTYEALISSIRTRFGAGPARPAPPPTELQPHLIIRGVVRFDSDRGELLPLQTTMAAAGRTMPGPGPYALELLNGEGSVLMRQIFDVPRGVETVQPGTFRFVTPVLNDLRHIRILRNGKILLDKTASPNAPMLRLIHPNGGESIQSDPLNIEWEASDPDLDSLTYRVEFSPDEGGTWRTLASDLTSTRISVPVTSLAEARAARVRVEATDGMRTTSVLSEGTFSVNGVPPLLAVISPAPDAQQLQGGRVQFEVATLNSKDSPIPEENLTWASDLEGVIGKGTRLDLAGSMLRPGAHTITVTGVNRAGQVAQAQTRIQVWAVPPPLLSNANLLPGNELGFLLRGRPGSTNVVDTSPDLIHWTPALTNINRLNRDALKLPTLELSKALFLRARPWSSR